MRLALLDFTQDRLDINDRRAVNRFDRTDLQATLFEFAHRDLVEGDRIGPIRGSGANTPVSRRLRSDRGWTLRVSRCARCTRVKTMSSSPTPTPSKAGVANG